MKKLLFITFVSVFLLSACGPEPAPTASIQDIQSTAVAAAMTMVAQTQAAIPTSTPVPPTETASPTLPPTNTVVPLVVSTQPQQLGVPTQPVAVQPTTAPTTSTDLCSDLKHVLPSDAAGPVATIRIVNENKAPATVSIYLNKTVFGECGYRSYQLAKSGGDVVVDLPQGCYSAWAWSQDPKNVFNASGYGLCANNSDKWTIRIRGESIIMNPP